MQVQDMVSIACMGVCLVLAPISVVMPWSSLKVALKSPVEGCQSMFEQHIGLSWAKQCNCDPQLGKSICTDIDVNSLPGYYSFLSMGGLLLKLLLLFSLLSTLISIAVIIYKNRRINPEKEEELLNYKPYSSWITSYTMILFLTILLIWSLFIQSSLDLRHGGKGTYANETGWTLCLVCIILSTLAALAQISIPSDIFYDQGDFYDEGDEGDMYSEEISDSESGGG